jgi:hypothetical protein
LKGDEAIEPSPDKHDELEKHHGKYFLMLINKAMNAYLSTPKFIMRLTDLSLELIE